MVFILLGLIILLGAFLRLWRLGSNELIFDEGLYSFRSIGYLDYLDSSAQTTPVQWLKDDAKLPFWTYLSFHDHPPLFFAIQFVFFKIFGDSFFVSRLPSALFGILAIFIVFLIARKIFEKENYRNEAGLIASFLLSINFSHILASRLAMMESVLLFFIFLNLYFFLLFLENKKYWIYFGASLGFAFLTKYVAVFLLPAYFLYLIIARRDLFKNWRLYTALLLTAIIFSPVIIYNIYSYKTFGHFDLQFAYILRQNLPWEIVTGGKAQEPFSSLYENSRILFSSPFLLIFLSGFIFSFYKKIWTNNLNVIFLFFVVSITVLLYFTGAALRFAALYIVPAIFLASATFFFLLKKKIQIFYILTTIFVLYEIWFLANPLFLNPPNYGVRALDKYFDQTLGNSRTSLLPQHPNPHLNKIISKHSKNYKADLPPTGIVYDENLALPATLWVLSRRQFYHGIPIMPAGVFMDNLKNENKKIFAGYELYFIKTGPGAPLNSDTGGATSGFAKEVETMLTNENQAPQTTLKSSDGSETFRIYKFSLN